MACAVFLDFQKALDTVDHDILHAKLEHYGIRGISLKLFKTYLTERTQHIAINNISKTLPIDISVLQGSILGHLLFLTHIFFNWGSLHARLNSHYKAWNYKKRSTKKITGYRNCLERTYS